MKYLTLFIRMFVAVLAVFSARAQEPRKTDKTVIPEVKVEDWKRTEAAADKFYREGQWLQAAAHYNALHEHVLKISIPGEEFEAVLFNIAVCMFRLEQHDEALKRFGDYVKFFSAGPKLPQVNLFIARTHRAQKNREAAIREYEMLTGSRDAGVRQEAVRELAECLKETGERGKAMALLESELADGLKDTEDLRTALYLVDLYGEKPEQAVEWLEKVKAHPNALEVAAEMNFTAVKLAEMLVHAEKFPEALVAFQNLRRRNEVMNSLESLLDNYERRIASLTKNTAARMAGPAWDLLRLDRLKVLEARAKTMLTALEKEGEDDAMVYYRMGRCFAALHRYWEARTAFGYVYDHFPKFKDRPSVLYALCYCCYMLAPQKPGVEPDPVHIAEECDRLLVEWLTKFGRERQEAAQVAEMRVSLAGRTKDTVRLLKMYEDTSVLLKGSSVYFAFQLQRIRACLEAREFKKAKQLCEKFRTEAPEDDSRREQVEDMEKLIPK